MVKSSISNDKRNENTGGKILYVLTREMEMKDGTALPNIRHSYKYHCQPDITLFRKQETSI